MTLGEARVYGPPNVRLLKRTRVRVIRGEATAEFDEEDARVEVRSEDPGRDLWIGADTGGNW